MFFCFLCHPHHHRHFCSPNMSHSHGHWTKSSKSWHRCWPSAFLSVRATALTSISARTTSRTTETRRCQAWIWTPPRPMPLWPKTWMRICLMLVCVIRGVWTGFFGVCFLLHLAYDHVELLKNCVQKLVSICTVFWKWMPVYVCYCSLKTCENDNNHNNNIFTVPVFYLSFFFLVPYKGQCDG